MSTAASTSEAPASNALSWLTWGLLGLLAALMVGLVVLFSIATSGLVNGEEFSPDLLERRSYAYYRIPWIGIQVSPVVNIPASDRVLAYIKANGWVRATQPAEPKWDFVQRHPALSTHDMGNALVLTRYLDSEAARGKPYWQEWSESHLDLAKILWPRVFEVVRAGQYVFLPELFAAAQAAERPADLKTELDRLLAEKYEHWGEVHEQLQRPDLAAQYYQHALRYQPERATAQAGLERVKSLPAPPPQSE